MLIFHRIMYIIAIYRSLAFKQGIEHQNLSRETSEINILFWLSKTRKNTILGHIFGSVFWRFRPLDHIVSTSDVDILNLQVISFQTRYRALKSVQPKLQKLTFCLGCQSKVKYYPQTCFQCHFWPLGHIVSTSDVDILNLQVISFQTRYRTSKSVQPKLQKLTFCVACLIGVELPSGWVVPGSCVINLWLLFENFVGGLFRWTFWLRGSPGKEIPARLVQGLSNWQV